MLFFCLALQLQRKQSVRSCIWKIVQQLVLVHRRFQTRASPGIAWVKFLSIVLIVYHYIVLQDEGAEPFDSKATNQSKARRLGGETGFFSIHQLTACTAHVARPGNLAALKPPLFL